MIQSILFDRNFYTLDEAKNWLRRRGYETGVDVKPNHFRFRQINPDPSYDYRTFNAGEGIQFVVIHQRPRKYNEEYYKLQNIAEVINQQVPNYINHEYEKQMSRKHGGAAIDIKLNTQAYKKPEERSKNVDGYKLDEDLSNKKTAVYYNDQGESIIAHRGTDPTNLADLRDDVKLVFGKLGTSKRVQKAKDITRQAEEKYQNVSHTGHSLGFAVADKARNQNDKLVGYSGAVSPLDIFKKRQNVEFNTTGIDPIAISGLNIGKTVYHKPKSFNVHSLSNYGGRLKRGGVLTINDLETILADTNLLSYQGAPNQSRITPEQFFQLTPQRQGMRLRSMVNTLIAYIRNLLNITPENTDDANYIQTFINFAREEYNTIPELLENPEALAQAMAESYNMHPAVIVEQALKAKKRNEQISMRKDYELITPPHTPWTDVNNSPLKNMSDADFDNFTDWIYYYDDYLKFITDPEDRMYLAYGDLGTSEKERENKYNQFILYEPLLSDVEDYIQLLAENPEVQISAKERERLDNVIEYKKEITDKGFRRKVGYGFIRKRRNLRY